MEFSLNTPVLPVSDVLRTQAYYCDVLGFTIDWRERDVFGGVSCGNLSLFFERTTNPPRGFTCVLNTANADEVSLH